MQDRPSSCVFGSIVALVTLTFAMAPATAASTDRLTPERDRPDRSDRLVKTAADRTTPENERAAVERAVAEQLLRSRPEAKPARHQTAPPSGADQSQVIDWMRTGRSAAQSCDDILARAQLGELGADDFGALRRCR